MSHLLHCAQWKPGKQERKNGRYGKEFMRDKRGFYGVVSAMLCCASAMAVAVAVPVQEGWNRSNSVKSNQIKSCHGT
jgi:hypothetical protein